MKNPFYVAPAAVVDSDDTEAAALHAATKYLQSDPNAEDVEDHKIRKIHPALQDPKVWEKVKAQLDAIAAGGGEAPRSDTKRKR